MKHGGFMVLSGRQEISQFVVSFSNCIDNLIIHSNIEHIKIGCLLQSGILKKMQIHLHPWCRSLCGCIASTGQVFWVILHELKPKQMKIIRSWRRWTREFWFSCLKVQKQRNVRRQEIQDKDRNSFSCSVYFSSGTTFSGNYENREFNKIPYLFKSV